MAGLAQSVARLAQGAEHGPSRLWLGLEGEARTRAVFRGKGCERCFHTGYRGRTAVYEMFELERRAENLRNVIAGRAPDKIRDLARSGGWESFREVAMKKLFRGETTVEEVLRRTPDVGADRPNSHP